MASEFDQWLRRLGDTYDALTYTCTYRIGLRSLAHEISFRVMSALVGNPQIFRHYGLPYSGRIARLAEPLIAQARQGDLPGASRLRWDQLVDTLRCMPADLRRVVVAGYLLGHRGAALGELLGCDPDSADRHRDDALRWLRAAAPAWCEHPRADHLADHLGERPAGHADLPAPTV